MSDAGIKARESRARREYPETRAAFQRVRKAAVDRMFQTRPNEAEKREELYRLVHILDSVEADLMAAMGAGSEEIETYLKMLER